MHPNRRLPALAALLALALAGCGGGDAGGGGGVTGVGDITSVSVVPATVTLTTLGQTESLSATASAGSTPVASAQFSWVSSNAAVATVDAAGSVTAVANGTTTITASVSGTTATGTVAVTVQQEAATITLAIADASITPGATTQVTASVADAGGSALSDPSLTWSTSDESVATVDDTGLVMGVDEGSVTITAARDGATGTVDAEVTRPTLVIDVDQELGGTVAVSSLSIAAGVVVSLNEDIEIDATGPVVIEGTVSGDCTSIVIASQAGVTISGTLNTACVATIDGGAGAPGVTIHSPGGVDLTDASIVTSGPIDIASEPSTASAGPAFGRVEAASFQPSGGTINLSGASLRADPIEAPQDPDRGLFGGSGSGHWIRAEAEIIVNGTTMVAGRGAPGLAVNKTSAEDLEVDGGLGGNGGDVRLEPEGSGVLRFGSSRGQTTLIGGDGGPGGPATATTTPNPSLEKAPRAFAKGGAGGWGGSVQLLGNLEAVPGTDLGMIVRQVGLGGSGGNATAVAADGVDATSTRDAQTGGRATAWAGDGQQAGTTPGGFEAMPPPDPKQGGGGGIGRATGGTGGDGIRSRPHGAAGGEASALGGRSGASTRTSGRAGGDSFAGGGNGGNGADVCPLFDAAALSGQIAVGTDSDGSDPFIFNAGPGGIALAIVYRVFNALGGPGGNGGEGGNLETKGGGGGQGQDSQAAEGVATLGPGANGGDGGAGIPGGAEGLPGSPGEFGSIITQNVAPVFQFGASGGACPSGGPSSAPAVSVGGRAAAAEDRAIEINGTAPWVDVAGTLADDGTVTATGQGTVAGMPDVAVSFSGTYDELTGVLQGVYSMDTESVISPGHPVLYDVDVSAPNPR